MIELISTIFLCVTIFFCFLHKDCVLSKYDWWSTIIWWNNSIYVTIFIWNGRNVSFFEKSFFFPFCIHLFFMFTIEIEGQENETLLLQVFFIFFFLHFCKQNKNVRNRRLIESINHHYHYLFIFPQFFFVGVVIPFYVSTSYNYK